MSCFSKLFVSNPEYRSASINISKNRFPFGMLGLPPSTKNIVIHSLCADFGGRALIITPDEQSAVKCCSDLCTYGTKAEVFPARDFNFRAVSTGSLQYEQKRTGALCRLLTEEISVIVCSAEAAVQRTIPPAELKKRILTVNRGDEISTDSLRTRLVAAGYTPAEMVEGPGQFSVRGGIADIFPSNSSSPLRIEFYGDEIDSISYFDILSQRRGEQIASAVISPCSEILFDSNEIFIERLLGFIEDIKGRGAVKARQSLNADLELLSSGIRPGCCDKYFPIAYWDETTVLDYFRDDLLFVCDTSAVKEHAQSAEKLLNEEIRDLFLEGTLCKGLDTFSMSFASLVSRYEKSRTVYIDNFARGSFDTGVKDLITFRINQLSLWDGSYKILLEDISPCLSKGYTVVVFAGTQRGAEGLLEELNEDELPAILCRSGVPETLQKGYINILLESVSAGMDSPGDKLLIVSYGRFAKAARKTTVKTKKNKNAFNSLEELSKGDYVVHETNGIGIFEGIEKVSMEGVTKDYIKISYAKGDVLFVPVTKLELISKYIGPHEEDGSRTVKLNRLGSGDWEKTKSRVRLAVKDIAADLIKIYAQRQASPGFCFSPDIDMQNDFERRFEFDETEDQLRCIDEIKHDMEKPCPMDRLLCGDVGFGKTEVALRAAFKCICDGKQVAILVPTTILALQHYRTIMHRFEGFPVEAEMLCRFRTPTLQKQITANLKSGGIDIIVGTHRIISKDVVFKDLGLLIVDEEQRFGVVQKEKLKEKFPDVDVLTLSATPIPRTLNFAMAGIRDLSVIEEAPMDRYPVQTYVLEHDPGILEAAVSKELRRGGQVYYLHNRVEDIEETAGRIKKLFPEANVGIAHGKMNEEELSDVWKDLLEGTIDILVCTTIIETGVDVPNVNTLIIENADRMGLAQLHQLRGRVGRSTRRASAYLTFRKDKQISEIAEKRLNTIREFTQFGSGFKIAMRDLEIRGAGNMLGAKQHGHMESVGYDMYMELLTEAINELKADDGKPVPVKKDCLVDIQIDAHIPDEYIESYPQRIAAYKRIADIHTPEDSLDVTDELIDRYGEPPKSVMGLIKVALLKNSAADNGIYEITQRGNSLLLFVPAIDKTVLRKLSVLKGRVMANASQKPYFSVRLNGRQTALECLEDIVDALNAQGEQTAE